METEQITLAPAAGSGIGKKLADALLADPGFVDLLKQTAVDGLNAMTGSRWDKASEQFVRDPDYKTRVSTLALILAHMEGEPVKRIIHQHLGGAGGIDVLGALQDSPALRDAARGLLEKADWRTSGNQAHKKPRKVGPSKEGEEDEV